MASYDREKFIEDYNKKLGKDEEKVVAKTATTNAKDAFLQEYKTKYEAKYPTAKQGQNYTAPAVVQPTVKTGKELAQQQNYDQMQQFFERSKKSDEEELNRINTEISAISGYGVGADRTGLEQLLKEKDVIEQRLKVGRYDEDLTPIERLQLTAQGIGESYNYAPGVIVDTAVQALRGDKTVNMDSDAIKGMQRANQATQQAMYGKGAAGQFAWGVGGSLIDNASRMPLTLLPGGKAINSAIAGARTSAQKMVDVGENGGTARDAFLRGVGSGAVEAGTEALGFDVALNTVLKNTGEGLLKDMAINAVTGAGEEGLAYLGNLAIDKLAKDPDAKFSREDLAMAMASGAVAEGILGGGASVIGSRIRKNNVNAQSNEANRANNDAENTPKRADNIDTLDDNASRASSEGMKAKVAENPALTAENETKSSNLDSYSA